MNFQFDFTGKRVLVTGSTMGIGRGAAEAFHSLGATVAVNGRSAEGVRKTIAELGGGARLIAAQGDLTDTGVRKRTVGTAIEQMGGLDILINNAGRSDTCCVDDVSEEYWRTMMDANLKAAFFTAQACVPTLKKSGGCIVNVSAAAALTAGPIGSSVYAATKGAIIQMTRMAALALAKEGVRVNAVAPGWIATSMIREMPPEYVEKTTPMGRIGTVDECTGAILYLAADFASFTTGSILVTDGGFSAGH